MDSQDEPRSTAAPPFTPQQPPSGLGVLRTIVLALMVFIGTAELLLFGGFYLAVSGSSPLPQASVVTGQNTSGSTYRKSGQAVPVSGNTVQAPGQNTQANQSGQEATPQENPTTQSSNDQNSQSTQPLSTQAETSSSGQQGASQQAQDNPQQSPADEGQGQPDETGNSVTAPQGNPPVQMDPPQQSGGNGEQSTQTVIPAPEGRTIYITPTGKKYHYDNHCNGGTYIESTLEEALAKGLTPCNKCVLK